MGNLAAVNAVLKHQIKRTTGEFLTTVVGAVQSSPLLALNSGACKVGLEVTNRFERKIPPVDIDDGSGLLFVDHELAVFHVVPERGHTAHPHALLLGGGDFVPHALADDLALKLVEGQQDVERQPSHTG